MSLVKEIVAVSFTGDSIYVQNTGNVILIPWQT